MTEIKTIEYDGLRLTQKTRQYRWHWDIGENGKHDISFADEDSINTEGHGRMKKMGIPNSERYRFSFYRLPTNKKKETLISICFDILGNYNKTRTYSNVSKKELKQWESEMMTYLINNGWITEEV